ncbi:ribonuclease R [Megasphaera hominis]|uniref:Ribonuclease R n=1 Tax=Megasphaera hominis TaxID=159836 RepID=A0ABR6VFD6_9FIRM|nr:ribonuclease R [Megasphaera hominis]MBC3535983.1 ribonuclease R [Megasphaera hominis]
MDKQLTHDIINICSETTEGATVEDCAEQLEIKGDKLALLFTVFDELVRSGILMRVAGERYLAVKRDAGIAGITGIYKGYTPNFGFVLTDDLQDDVYIAEANRHTAMNNDKVEVRLIQNSRGHRQEGEIIRIVERANTDIVGTYDRQKTCGFVTPDDERLREDIYVPLDKTKDARSSARVLVHITRWPEAGRKAEGEITEILGYDGDKDLDIKVIMARHGLPFAFPDAVLEEANRINTQVTVTEDRKDYRDRNQITIDSEDAKDLDDAIDVVRLPNGNFRLGVYIADVSWYVKPNSAIDQEAYTRGTSVYLVDRVIPMLPTVLSNGICSLNAGEDRYSMTCVMEIDHQGKVVNYEIAPAVIRVKRRCNYHEIKNALLNGIIPDDLQPFMPMLEDLKEVTQILKNMRMRRGAIDFDFPEYKIILDPEGKPLRLEKRDRSLAEQIVEESMLIANETVACYLRDSENPSVYRIHEVPDPERLEMMRTVLSSFNLPVPKDDEVKPADFQRLIEKSKGTEAELIVQTIALRSMQQAKYSTVNAGHFGLASECYTHFTSPIRRYPDLMVHRLIRQTKRRGKLKEQEAEQSLAYHTQASIQASTRERVAVEAERETDDLKKAEYMVPFVGQPFDAHITGITSFGLFVGLENGIEGLIHISLLTDDTYEFDENTYTMRGLFGGHVYRLGDPLEVTLANVNLEKCEIDFVPGRVESLEDLQKILAASAERRHHRSGSRERKQPSWQESKDAKYGSGKKKKKGKKDKKEKKTSTAKKNGHKGKKKSHKGGRAGKK